MKQRVLNSNYFTLYDTLVAAKLSISKLSLLSAAQAMPINSTIMPRMKQPAFPSVTAISCSF